MQMNLPEEMLPTEPEPTPIFTRADVGCYGDSHRGIYMGELVQEIATAHGWTGEQIAAHDQDDKYSEWYHEATDEAEQYLNTLSNEDVYWGSGGGGDWGLWAIDEEGL